MVDDSTQCRIKKSYKSQRHHQILENTGIKVSLLRFWRGVDPQTSKGLAWWYHRVEPRVLMFDLNISAFIQTLCLMKPSVLAKSFDAWWYHWFHPGALLDEIMGFSQEFWCLILKFGKVAEFTSGAFTWDSFPYMWWRSTLFRTHLLVRSILRWTMLFCPGLPHFVLGLVGPVLVCGDFNSPLCRWPTVRGLLERGWVDLGLLQAEVSGEEPQPTCLGVVRHSFHIANSALGFGDPLVSCLPRIWTNDVPCRVPRVPKWVLPRSFLEGPVDKIALDRHLSTSYQSCVDRVEELLTGNDIAAAIAHWSKCQEQAFDAASCHCDGAKRHLRKKYFGRCQRTEPKMVQLAMPRCKTGRPGDYQPPHLIASTHVRQLVRQTRRLQRLWHILAHRDGPVLRDAVELWNAICCGTGFGKLFPKWCIARLGWFPVQLPSSVLVGEFYHEVREYTDEASRKAWPLKREAFEMQLEDSCAREGSSLPCRLVKEETQPIVTEMKIQKRLDLSPQRWMPGGKAWIKVKNPTELSVGNQFSVGDVETQSMEIARDAVRLDRLVPQGGHGVIVHTEVEVDPVKWTGHFMQSWETFW